LIGIICQYLDLKYDSDFRDFHPSRGGFDGSGISHPNTQQTPSSISATIPIMTRAERITIDPNICHGKPCVHGLRYPVEHVLEWLSSGMTHEEILADYADLEREDIFAVLEFATQLSRVKRLELRAA
jgi:uncharacterized protein (DUF433 family)